jgi:hypothetical protein
MNRTERRKVGAVIRAAAAYREGIPFSRALCDSLRYYLQMLETSDRWEDYKAAQHAQTLFLGLLDSIGLPSGMALPNWLEGRNFAPAAFADHAERCAEIRRMWLRHWEETGVTLDEHNFHTVTTLRRQRERVYRFNSNKESQ